MAAVDAESKALSGHLAEVTDALNKTEQQHGRVGQAAYRHRTAIQDLNKQYNQFHQEYQQATQRSTKIHQEWEKAWTNKAPITELLEWKRKYKLAQEDEDKALERAQNTYARLSRSIQDAQAHVRNFTTETQTASQHIKSFANELEKVNGVVERVAHTLSTTLLSAFKSLAIAGGIGGAGGLLGLLGGGGIEGIAGITAAIAQLSGVMALIPAAAGGAGLALGTLAVGMHGVMDALKSMDDPAKFSQAIRTMAPAAQEVMIILSHFTDSYRGAMREVQQSLFAPIVDDIRPLIQTWLPLLMHAGQQIGTVFGQAAHQFLQFITSSQNLQLMEVFVSNITQAMRALLPSMQPILEAFRTLAVVGSQFLPQISNAIVKIANEFNNWIQTAAQTGELQKWIQNAITGFGQLFDFIKNVGIALHNISSIADEFGSNFLTILQHLGQEFRAWTESAEGRSTLTEFFKAAHAAAQALTPVLHTLGTALGQLMTNLLNLGVAMGPQVNQFFQVLGQAINQLAGYLIQAGPSIGDAFVTLAQALLQIVQSVGPSLPTLFKDFAQILKDLAPTVKTVADFLGQLLARLTPTELKWILGITLAFVALAQILPAIATGITIITGAMAIFEAVGAPVILIIVAVIAVLALLGVAIYEVVTHWDTIKRVMGEVWDAMKSFAQWVGNEFVHIWDDVVNAVKACWNAITNFFGSIGDAFVGAWNTVRTTVANWWQEAYNWGKNIIESLARGIRESVESILKPVLDFVSSLIPDSWKTHSPAKRGPLHDNPPEDMGAGLVASYAAGISGAAPQAGAAASGVGGAAAGGLGGATGTGKGDISTTGTGFSTAGQGGVSGGGVKKDSGFDQWIDWLTKDMEAWKNIFQSAFNLAMHVANIAMGATRLVADLWNRGDNPLMRPGGFFGRRLTPQEQVYGVPQVQEAGQAPDAWARNLPGGPSAGQEGVGGVPGVDLHGNVVNQPSAGGQPPTPKPWWAPGTPNLPPPGPAPPANPPPPSAAPAAAVSVPATQLEGPPIAAAPGDSPLVAALKQKGFSPQLIRLIQGFSQTEGLNPAGNPTLGWTDAQLNGDTSLQGHVNALAQQFKDRAAVAGPFPQGGTDQQQAEWIAIVGGQNASPSDWQANPQPADYGQRVVRALPGQPIPVGGGPSAPTPPGAPARPTYNAQDFGGVKLTDTQGPGARILNFSGTINAQDSPIDCGPASARIVLQGDAHFAGQGAKQIEDAISAKYGTGQGPGTYAQALRDLAPQANWQLLTGSGGSPQALMQAVQQSINQGWGGVLNYNTTDTGIRPVRGDRPFTQGTNIQHFVSVAGFDLQAGTIDIIDPAGTPDHPGAARYTLSIQNAYDLSKARGFIGAGPGATGGQGAAGPAPAAPPGPAPPPPNAPPPPPLPPKVPTGDALNGRWVPSPGATVESLNQPGHPGWTYYNDNVPETGVQQPSVEQLKAQVQPPAPGAPPPAPAAPPPPPPPPAPKPSGQDFKYPKTQDQDWLSNPPQGWDLSQPVPLEVRRQHNIPDNVPPIYYARPAGPLPITAAVPGSAAPTLQPGEPNLMPPNPAYFPNYVAPPGTPFVDAHGNPISGPGAGWQYQGSPADMASQVMSGVGTIASDIFTNIDDFIKSVGATQDITDIMVRGVQNTENIVKIIEDIQTYIKTAADVAKTVSDVLGEASKFVGAGAGADPSGGAAGAAAALGAASAIAGIVGEVLGAVNEGISLGIMVYHEVGKYVGVLEGFLLGGAATGPLSGNVRMLLNTNTGEIYTYSTDNPLNKNVKTTPFTRAYAPGPGQRNLNAQLNIYAGPGQSTQQMMSDSMWMIQTGAPAVASVSGAQ